MYCKTDVSYLQISVIFTQGVVGWIAGGKTIRTHIINTFLFLQVRFLPVRWDPGALV